MHENGRLPSLFFISGRGLRALTERIRRRAPADHRTNTLVKQAHATVGCDGNLVPHLGE
jgi:hypothetical protein